MNNEVCSVYKIINLPWMAIILFGKNKYLWYIYNRYAFDFIVKLLYKYLKFYITLFKNIRQRGTVQKGGELIGY